MKMITGDTCHHPVTATLTQYTLSKSEIVNITVRGRMRNPLPARHSSQRIWSSLTASGACANTNSICVLTSFSKLVIVNTNNVIQHPAAQET